LARTALTALAISKLKATAKSTRREKYDAIVPGFGVRVTAEGSKSWIFVYVSPTTRKRRRFTMGPVLGNDLETARQTAVELRNKVREGIDPAEEAETAKAQANAAIEAAAEAAKVTATYDFCAVVEQYVKRGLAKKRRGWEVERIIDRELIPHWGNRQITEITAEDIEERIEALVDAEKPEAARRLFEIIRRIFNWSLAQPRYKKVLLDRSPADRMRAADLIGDKVRRKRVLTNDELRALWRAAERSGYPFGGLVKVLLLTALRRNEAANAQWAEFDLVNQQWTIPPSRMKGNAPHVVPLTADMIALIEALPRFAGDGDFLFSTGDGKRPTSGFSKMKRRLDGLVLAELREIAEARGQDPATITLDPWRLHDIRRTVRTHLSALPVPQVVRERILAHAQRGLDDIYDQYDYLEEKRQALELWSARLRRIVSPDNVVPIGGRQREAV
jgi:integrase